MSRAVVFDVDGVLVHGYHANPERQQRWDDNLLADLGIEPERFRTEFIFDIFVKKVVVGKMPLIEALDQRLPSLGYRNSSMRFVDYWLSHDSKLNEPLIAIVRQLRVLPGIKLYIATNQDHARAQWLWQGLGFSALFDDIFYSARAGAQKPQDRFFDFAEARMERFTLPPLFFDDTQKVIDGARRRGWEAVLFDTVTDCAEHPWIAEQLR